MSEPLYLIWSHEHHRWWRPAGAGYTDELWHAGRYDQEAATSACRRRSWDEGALPPEVMVLAPENGRDTFTVDEVRHLDHEMCVRIDRATDEALTQRSEGVRP